MKARKKYQETLLQELKNEEFAFEFIRDALEGLDSDDSNYLFTALQQVAKAHGISDLEKETGITRSAIYKMLSSDSNPSFKNVSKILHALGFKFDLQKIENEERIANVNDVAFYILKTTPRKNVTAFWLQKLVYYSQVISLTEFNKPLFSETIQAWANGPVVVELYQKHKGVKSLASWDYKNLGNDSNLSARQKNCIDLATAKYGKLDGDTLSELTHSEAPWIKARGKIGQKEPCTNPISKESILEFYSSRPNYALLEEIEV